MRKRKRNPEQHNKSEYRNAHDTSSIEWYETGDDYIKVKFVFSEKVYKYTYKSCGKNRVESMKKLAERGHGLNAYVNRYQPAYEK